MRYINVRLLLLLLLLQTRTTRLEVSQGHQAWYLSYVRYVRYRFLVMFYSNFVPLFLRYSTVTFET